MTTLLTNSNERLQINKTFLTTSLHRINIMIVRRRKLNYFLK